MRLLAASQGWQWYYQTWIPVIFKLLHDASDYTAPSIDRTAAAADDDDNNGAALANSGDRTESSSVAVAQAPTEQERRQLQAVLLLGELAGFLRAAAVQAAVQALTDAVAQLLVQAGETATEGIEEPPLAAACIETLSKLTPPAVGLLATGGGGHSSDSGGFAVGGGYW